MELDVRGPTATALSSAQRTVAHGSRLGGKLCTDGCLVYSTSDGQQTNYSDFPNSNFRRCYDPSYMPANSLRCPPMVALSTSTPSANLNGMDHVVSVDERTVDRPPLTQAGWEKFGDNA